MPRKLLFQLVLTVISCQCLAQPYGGTIFVESNIITASDSSVFEGATYTGRGQRVVYDRRVNNWITVDAYLFDVVWNDGLTSEAIINPEFGSVALAQIEAEKYGFSIGQLPYCLRLDVDGIWVHKGVNLYGGGNRSILIHTGQTTLYERDGILEETLVHEASHTSLDAAHAASDGWLSAQEADGGFISDYARDNPEREDIAESYLLWMAVRFRKDKISETNYNLITQAIPNRLQYFDRLVCDLSPFEQETITSTDGLDQEQSVVTVYPNPTNDLLHLNLVEGGTYSGVIYNALGEIVIKQDINRDQTIDFSRFTSGVYFLLLEKDGQQIMQKVLKF